MNFWTSKTRIFSVTGSLWFYWRNSHKTGVVYRSFNVKNGASDSVVVVLVIFCQFELYQIRTSVADAVTLCWCFCSCILKAKLWK